jgi:hypothetical protein
MNDPLKCAHEWKDIEFPAHAGINGEVSWVQPAKQCKLCSTVAHEVRFRAGKPDEEFDCYVVPPASAHPIDGPMQVLLEAATRAWQQKPK